MAKYDNIPGCPGYYISKRGQIYSRVIPNGNDAGKLRKVWRERKVKIMVKTPTYSTKRVKIRNKSYSVSRLVALAWVPNPDNKPCVCHKDNDPLNNHYKNLYWGTHQENMAQMVVDGRKQKGEECPRKKKLSGFVCGAAERKEMQRTGKSRNFRGITRHSSPRPASRRGREVPRPSLRRGQKGPDQ